MPIVTLTNDAPNPALAECQNCKLLNSSCMCHTKQLAQAHLATAQTGRRLNKAPLVPRDIRRLTPMTICGLYPGSKFRGQQRSRGNAYDVEVEIQYVDLEDSFLAGYLRIKGLTEDYPELTTFFEAEIVGNKKYSFLTRKWEADEYIDAKHWKQFPAFQPYEKVFNEDGFEYDFRGKDHIFMRWKEHFLVPNHRINQITGASFAGFYYTCYELSTGTITGFYYHTTSDMFQRLSLQHEEERCFPTFEFR
ncbi:uncharacterized protein VTP21DRAFT_10526 [Calcarisporiella thermophila]|uniref:uncharacterized protein n=1 Tax=Calcarisporiella thermophila TaxID=911321 RepID=UPI003743EB73